MSQGSSVSLVTRLRAGLPWLHSRQGRDDKATSHLPTLLLTSRMRGATSPLPIRHHVLGLS